MKTILNMLTVIALLVVIALGIAGAQQPAVVNHVDGVEVRLEPKDGRAQFKLDEPITLELVFVAHTTGFAVNTVVYPDMSEQVDITPAEGWFRQREHSSHDYLTKETLGETPIRIPVLLNQGIVFLKPGRYEISITTSRLMDTQDGTTWHLVKTNPVSIEVAAPDEKAEADLVRSLSSQIAASSGKARKEAAAQLAFLGGDEAVRAKVRWLSDPGQEVQQEMLKGLASSRNLQLQLELLQAVWRDPQHVPSNYVLTAIEQTRAFSRKQTLPGWTMVFSEKKDQASKLAQEDLERDLSEIVATLPQRTGMNRRETAYFLIFNSLSASEKAVVRPSVLAAFGQMEPMEQAMLLESRWTEIRDPSLIPDLEAILNAPDKLQLHRYALPRLIELTPETGKLYAVREICDSRSPVMLDQLKDLQEDTLPEVDACLEKQLRASINGKSPQLQWKAMIAARFASQKMLPAMREIYAARTDPAQQAYEGAFLAYFLRYAPQEAIERIDTLGANAQPLFFYVDSVFTARKAALPVELQAWLREKLKQGQPQEARWAAYELSRFGKAEDKLLVEQRLEKVREQWRDRSSEVETSSANSPAAEARVMEADLVSTLASNNGTVWTVTPDEKAHLRQGCLSSQCRIWLPEKQ